MNIRSAAISIAPIIFPLAKVGVPAVSITLANVSTFNGPNAERARKLATGVQRNLLSPGVR